MQVGKSLVGLGSLLLALSFTAPRGAGAAPPTVPPAAPAAPKASPPADKGAPMTAGEAAKPPQPAAEAPKPQAGAAAPVMDAATHTVRLRDLEERIDQLKERIRHQRTRLGLLTKSILDGGGAEARVSIKFASELSGAFRVSRVMVVLDGAVWYNQADPSGTLTGPFEIPIFNGFVPSGDHTVQVLVNLQGDGHGVFSYLRGYRFEVRSSHSFTAIEGKTVNLDAVSYEKGTVTTPFEERPALRYGEKIVAGLADTAAPATAPPPRAP